MYLSVEIFSFIYIHFIMYGLPNTCFALVYMCACSMWDWIFFQFYSLTYYGERAGHVDYILYLIGRASRIERKN